MSGMTTLDTGFVSHAAREPIEVEHAGKTFQFGPTTAHWELPSATVAANLEVTEGGTVVGYVLPYADNQWHILPASLMTTEATPSVSGTVEEALDRLP